MKFSLIFTLVALLFSSSVFAHQKLLLIGGGVRPPEALKRWVKLTQEDQTRSGKVLILTWASEIPEEVDAGIRGNLNDAGAEVVSSFRGPKTATYAADKKIILDQINSASGVFFSGGDQNRILKVLEDEDILKAIKTAYWKFGVPFAGTSAGTAIMSEVMILGETLGVGTGLGFLPHTVVDQHFLKRNRVERLKKALKLAPPGFLGVGVDEDGSILWQNSENPLEFTGEVIGEKQVMVLRPNSTNTALEQTLLKPRQTTKWTVKDTPEVNCSKLLR